jgi:hypothetical protein
MVIVLFIITASKLKFFSAIAIFFQIYFMFFGHVLFLDTCQ